MVSMLLAASKPMLGDVGRRERVALQEIHHDIAHPEILREELRAGRAEVHRLRRDRAVHDHVAGGLRHLAHEQHAMVGDVAVDPQQVLRLDRALVEDVASPPPRPSMTAAPPGAPANGPERNAIGWSTIVLLSIVPPASISPAPPSRSADRAVREQDAVGGGMDLRSPRPPTMAPATSIVPLAAKAWPNSSGPLAEARARVDQQVAADTQQAAVRPAQQREVGGAREHHVLRDGRRGVDDADGGACDRRPPAIRSPPIVTADPA